MKSQILSLLDQHDLTAKDLRQALNCRMESLYLTLVQMEASGLVKVWPRSPAKDNLWCLA